jgi:hypothetical protein
MIKLTPSRVVALATLAAIAVGLTAPAVAVPCDRNSVERGDLVYVPADSGCSGSLTSCDLARY